MGTWSAGILGNDTSAQTHERFFALWDAGTALPNILKTIQREMKSSLAMVEDRTNVELALALALWECGRLDRARLASVRAIHEQGIDRTAYEALDADPKFLAQRQRAVATLVKKLETRNGRPRARPSTPKPKAQAHSKKKAAGASLQAATCFYVVDAGRAYTFWVASASRGKGWGALGVMWLDTGSTKAPTTLQECERAFVRGVRKNAAGDPRGTWRAQTSLLMHEGGKSERELDAAIAAHCTVVGRTARLATKRVFLDSSGSSLDLSDGKNLVRRLAALANDAKKSRTPKGERLGAWLTASQG